MKKAVKENECMLTSSPLLFVVTYEFRINVCFYIYFFWVEQNLLKYMASCLNYVHV